MSFLFSPALAYILFWSCGEIFSQNISINTKNKEIQNLKQKKINIRCYILEESSGWLLFFPLFNLRRTHGY